MATEEQCKQFQRRIDDVGNKQESLEELLKDHLRQDVINQEKFDKRHIEYLTSIEELSKSIGKSAEATAVLTETLIAGRLLARFGKWLGSIAIFGWVAVFLVNKFGGGNG